MIPLRLRLAEWLALDEQERIALARDYHRRKRIRLPNVRAHAVAHAIVESQIVLGDETPARHTAQRLMDEGLDRHEAILAIGMVLLEFIYDLMRAPASDSDPNPPWQRKTGGDRGDGLRKNRSIWPAPKFFTGPLQPMASCTV